MVGTNFFLFFFFCCFDMLCVRLYCVLYIWSCVDLYSFNSTWFNLFLWYWHKDGLCFSSSYVLFLDSTPHSHHPACLPHKWTHIVYICTISTFFYFVYLYYSCWFLLFLSFSCLIHVTGRTTTASPSTAQTVARVHHIYI